MDARTLRTLHEHAGTPWGDLAGAAPEAYAAAIHWRADDVRTRLGELSRELPPDAARGAALDGLDLAAVLREGRDLRRAVADAVGPDLLPDPGPSAGTAPPFAAELGLDQAPDPARPVAEQPALAPLLAQAEIAAVAAAAGLDDAVVDAVLPRTQTLGALDDTVLSALGDDGVLTPDQADGLGLTVSLYHLLDRDLPRAVEVRGRVGSLRDVIALDAAGWRDIVGDAGDPEGLAARTGALFPGEALVARLLPGDRDTLEARMAAMSDAHLDDLGTTFPGLGIPEILHSGAAAADRRRQVVDRLELLKLAVAQNPALELLELDYTPGSPDLADLRTPDMTPEDRSAVVNVLKAYQRAYTVAGDVGTAAALLRGGFSSAGDVIGVDTSAIAARAQLDEVTARQVKGRAQAAYESVTVSLGAVLEVVRDGGRWAQVANLSPGTAVYLRRLDGYAGFFGSQAACRCTHCRSVLSPAAYLVDLLAMVDARVRRTHFVGARAGSPLDLRARRPDLWSGLELTCANTNDLVPSVVIANEILEAEAARRTLPAGTSPQRVYRDTLSSTLNSFRQPFWLPLARLAEYLDHAGTSRPEIARVFASAPAAEASAELGLPLPNLTRISTADTDRTRLARVYGVSFRYDAAGLVAPFDVQLVLGPTSLTRDGIGALLATSYVRAGSPQPIVVTPEKRSTDSVQNDIERVHGLTADALDRLERFTRLQRRLPWSPGELDLVLTAGGGGLDDTALDRITRLRRAQDELGVPADELCALVGPIPDRPTAAGTPALLQRLFAPPAGTTGEALPGPARGFVLPAFRAAGAPDADVLVLHRLFAAAGLTTEAFTALVVALASVLGVDPEAPQENDRDFALSAENLALLYRHARLAQRLRVTVPQLFQQIALSGTFRSPAPATPATHIADLAGLEALLRFRAWWHGTAYSADDLGRITGGPVLATTAPPDDAALAAGLVAGVAGNRLLTFSGTVFSLVPEVTEEQSRAVVAANPTRVVATGDGSYRLADDFDPAVPLAVLDPAGDPLTPATEPELRGVVAGHAAGAVLVTELTAALGAPAEIVRSLLALLGTDLRSAALARAVRGAAPPAPIADLMTDLRRLLLLFRDDGFDAAALDVVRARAADLDLTDARHPGMTAVRRVATLAAVLGTQDDATAVTTEPPAPAATPADAAALLSGYTAAGGFPAAADAALGRVLGVTPRSAATLRGAVPRPAATAAVDALEALVTAAGLVRRLGVDAEVLSRAVSTDYDALDAAAEALRGALHAAAADQDAFTAVMEPAENEVLTQRQAALVDLLVTLPGSPFTTPADLYDHFLVDVEMAGCARTTRIASAIASVQLYVHRIRMNLEQDERAPADPAHVHVPPSAIPAGEWSWRRNYRVWEANRKVFLNPENYLEPQLRDDKTPLYQALENDLLQKEITDDSVLDAYGGYLRGLDEVAGLTLAGAYHEVSTDPDGPGDCLHLFGATSADPPAFYYRRVENLNAAARDPLKGVTWTPWRQLDVQIAGRRVSPVMFLGRLHLFWTQLVTRSVSEIAGGTAAFAGYRHTMALKFTTLKPDGTWTTPQDVSLSPNEAWPYSRDAGLIPDPLPVPGRAGVPKLDTETHDGPRESYTLRGPSWDTVHLQPNNSAASTMPGRHLSFIGRNFAAPGVVDLFARSLRFDILHLTFGQTTTPYLCARRDADFRRRLYTGFPFQSWPDNPAGLANLLLDEARIDLFTTELVTVNIKPGLYAEQLAVLSATDELMAVGGSPLDVVVQSGADSVLLHGSPTAGQRWAVRRLNTTLGPTLSETLFLKGVDGLLATEHQMRLAEPGPPLAVLSSKLVPSLWREGLDFRGPFGTYFRELFFHIPLQIAVHLNAQQKFDAAQRWFHFVFNPTADETPRPDARSVAAARDADDRVHVLETTAEGQLRHTFRRADGTWQPFVGEVRYQSTGSAWAGGTAAAVDSGNRLHVVVVSRTGGGLLHTIRYPDGSWQPEIGDVKAANTDPGPFVDATCAAAGDVHVLGATPDGGLWHTLRHADGSWQGFFGDVKAVTSDPGPVRRVAAGGDTAGDLHLLAVTANGGLFHTIRHAAATWAALNDVKPATSDPGPVTRAACSGDAGGDVHLVAITADGGMWHAIRHNDGSWAGAFVDVVAAAGSAPGPFAEVSCAGGAAGVLHVHAVTTDGVTWRTMRRPEGSWDGFDPGIGNDKDSNWRYSEFRGLRMPRLRDILTDSGAIEAYRKDPFNPHAIARLRLSAYQKYVVMRYVDNLLDWGDSLFTEFTAESVNEATMLYVMAADILGDRPAELGDCGADDTPRRYADLADLVASGAEFLLELETLSRATDISKARRRRPRVLDASAVAAAAADTGAAASPGPGQGLSRGLGWKATRTETWTTEQGTGRDAVAGRFLGHLSNDPVRAVSLGRSIASAAPVFCIPPNTELRSYWDRVEERLDNIRNCRDITGAARTLAPFAPDIDPRMLVRARAEGVSLSDALDAGAGELPPYRFSVLVERARSHAATVQAFGSALLGAFERKDLEELTRLRGVHQQNLLSLGTAMRQDEIDAAQDGIEAMESQLAAAEYRRDYYLTQRTQNLSPSEKRQLEARNAASLLQSAAGTLDTLAGILHLVPQIGAPTAMKFGGMELGKSASGWSGVMRDAASVFEANSAAAGLAAGFERRTEGWGHQLELARREIDLLNKQLAAFKVRKRTAERALAVHEASVAQEAEVRELYGAKFTNLGLYEHLSSTLQRLHREAYNGALATARLAEQAYRFERNDYVTTLLAPSYWDAARGGLLAGDRLQLDLMNLERRYMEGNHRDLEVDQAFALTQIDPAALLRLRESGTCEFTVPELFFDLFYPGQYRRRLMAVRVTIPCIAGPYVNVGATLTLQESWIRSEPRLGATALSAVPRRRSVQVATSTAQADAGVFELSFRDDRLLPFQGQGAVSSWRLSLPESFRQFDYRTINDVVLTLSYTAQHDENLRREVEAAKSTAEGAIRQVLADRPMTRVFSMRQDFSMAFHRLLHSPAGVDVDIDISAGYLPPFLNAAGLQARRASIVLRPAAGQAITGFALRLDTTDLTAFPADPNAGNLPAARIDTVFAGGLTGRRRLRVVSAGALAPTEPTPGDPSSVDDEKLADILLVVEYNLPQPPP